MGWLDRFKKAAAVAEVAAKIAAPKDARGNPGTRIYHEYFAPSEPVNGRYQWSARVYAADGTPYEMTGSEETHRATCLSALAWAEETKAMLRGKV